MSKSSPGGRRHHVVPRFYLRRFADEKERLVGFDRRVRRQVPLSVGNAAVRCGFYDVPGPTGPSGEVEDALATLEGLAAEITERLIEHGIGVLSIGDRYRLTTFMAIQCVRGVDFTRATLAVAGLHAQLNTAASSLESRERVAELLGVGIDDVDDGTVVGGFTTEEVPPEWWLRTAAIGFVSQEIGKWLFTRRWYCLTVDEPSFVTSDRPVVLYRRDSRDGEPTGFRNADLVMTPLSRRAALLMARDDFDVASAWSDTELAVRTINAVVGASAYEWIFHHPEDAHLAEAITLPAAAGDATAGPLEFIRDGDVVRARSRVIPWLPTPPLGWRPPDQ